MLDNDFDNLIRQIREEITDKYNDALYDVIYNELQEIADRLSDEFYFTDDVRLGTAADDVYDWLAKYMPNVLAAMKRDLELVGGHDAIWSALEALHKVEDWSEFTEEEAAGMEQEDYEKYRTAMGPRESVLEGIASTRKNYLDTGKINDKVFDAIKEADPSKNKKYMDWVAKVVSSKFPKDHDYQLDFANNLAPLVKQYHEAVEKNLVPKDKRDIYKLDWDEFYSLYDELKGKETKTQQKKRVKLEGAEKVLDNDQFVVVEIHTHEAMMEYGKHTQWCVTTEDPEDYINYINQGIWFYVVIAKQDVPFPDDPENLLAVEGEKYAIAFRSSGRYEVYDERDQTLTYADDLVELLSNMGADFADYQPDEVVWAAEEAMEKQREQRYEQMWEESISSLAYDLPRQWAEREHEYKDAMVIPTSEFDQEVEDDAEELAAKILQDAHEFAFYKYDPDESEIERNIRYSISGAFEEAESEGSAVYLSDDEMLFILDRMGYIIGVGEHKEEWELRRGDYPGQRKFAFAEERKAFVQEMMLLEGIASTRKNYLETGKITDEAFEAIKEADPSKNKKYMDWMAKQAAEHYGDEQKHMQETYIKQILGPAIQKYHDALERGLVPKDKRDIYQMNLQQFSDLHQELKTAVSKTQQKKRVKLEGADKILDNDQWEVYEIYTHEAMQYYGSHTKWCVTEEDSDYWRQYTEDEGVWFYVAIAQDSTVIRDPDDLSEELFEIAINDKFAIAFKGDVDVYEVYEADDTPLDRNIADWIVATLHEMGAEFSTHQPAEVDPGEEVESDEARMERLSEEFYANSLDWFSDEIKSWMDLETYEDRNEVGYVQTDKWEGKHLRDIARELMSEIWHQYGRYPYTAQTDVYRELGHQIEMYEYEEGSYLEADEDQMIAMLEDLGYYKRDPEHMKKMFAEKSIDEIHKDLMKLILDFREEGTIEINDTPAFLNPKYVEQDVRSLAAYAAEEVWKWVENLANAFGYEEFEKLSPEYKKLSQNFHDELEDDIDIDYGDFLQLNRDELGQALVDLEIFEYGDPAATIAGFIRAGDKLDNEQIDALRRMLAVSDFSKYSDPDLRAMSREEVMQAAEEAVEKWKESEEGKKEYKGQRKFAFAEERRIMEDLLNGMG